MTEEQKDDVKTEDGKTLTVSYTGKLDDGTIFDSTEGKDPLKFTIGKGQLIPGFEKEVEGMKKGEKKTFTIQPENAYGMKDDKLVQKIPKEGLPEGAEIKVGQRLKLQSPTGQVIIASVKEIDDKSITLDMNHPLAGKALTFEVTIVDIS